MKDIDISKFLIPVVPSKQSEVVRKIEIEYWKKMIKHAKQKLIELGDNNVI